MKFREIRGGLRVPVSLEEQDLLDLIETHEGVVKRLDLDERQRELARKLVSRDILHRIKQDESLFYVLTDLNEIWSK